MPEFVEPNTRYMLHTDNSPDSWQAQLCLKKLEVKLTGVSRTLGKPWEYPHLVKGYPFVEILLKTDKGEDDIDLLPDWPSIRAFFCYEKIPQLQYPALNQDFTTPRIILGVVKACPPDPDKFRECQSESTDPA